MAVFVRLDGLLMAAILGGLVLSGCAGRATAADLAAHRALYAATLEKDLNGTGAIAAEGTMVLSLERACDGWISTFQTVVDTTLDNGQAIRQDLRFAGWESLDGKTYRFSSRQRVGNAEVGFKGSARKADPTADGVAEFIAPAKETIALSADTLFPIGHMAWLIDQALAGRRQAVRILFEGAGGEGAQQVAVFIGARQSPPPDAPTQWGALAARPGWPMQMGFYPPDGRSPSPAYEADIFQLDNGVARSMVIGMGGFSVRLKLLKVEPLAAPRC